jgi:lipopolysaccharide/colanic/teichoic acid biosynthesis glycosyltransferase
MARGEHNKREASRQSRHAPRGGFDFSPWARLASASPPPRPQRAPRLRPGVIERCIAALLLLAASPLMLLVALAIKIDSPGGPVLYRQARVGLNRRAPAAAGGAAAPPAPGHALPPDRRRTPGLGEVFRIYKFRTMVPDAEQQTGPVWAAANDPRITRVGALLRRSRIDELPQLLNVILGQMRLIGPRPERPHFVQKLSDEIPGYPDRQRVPPGITGLAQVEREYDSDIDAVRKKIMYDLFYVRNRCSLLDLKILIKTIDVMVRGRGAR